MKPLVSDYHPEPIDTSEIKLPKELEQLTEILARNAHDVWAVARLKEGWVYGEERSDQAKTNPDLKAYEELTEQEKDYDVRAAVETLKAILALGFTIKPPPESE